MLTRCLLFSAAVFSIFIQLSDSQILAQLCYRRERGLNCVMDSPLKEGALMNIGSVTVALSTDEQDLRTGNQDGQSCREIKHQCTVNMRPSNLHTFPQQLTDFYTLVETACVNKTTCDIVMPDWDFINLEVLEPGCPAVAGKTYHFKSTLLDLRCYFPPPPTTKAPEVEFSEVTDEENGGEVTDEEDGDEVTDGEDGGDVMVPDEEVLDAADNSTMTDTDEYPPPNKEGDEEPDKDMEGDDEVQPPPKPGPNGNQGSEGDSKAGHMTCSATITILSLAWLISL